MHGPEPAIGLAAWALLLSLAACGPTTETTPASPSPLPMATPPAGLTASLEPTETCNPVEVVPPFSPKSMDQQHVDPENAPPLEDYGSSPPTSGPHGVTTLPAGVYPQPPDLLTALHSLEHGAAIIWYRSDAVDTSDLEALAQRFQDPAFAEKTILAPYEYPMLGPLGELPDGTVMALVSWHHLQTCDRLDMPTIDAFLEHYRAPTLNNQTYLGDAPEGQVGI